VPIAIDRSQDSDLDSNKGSAQTHIESHWRMAVHIAALESIRVNLVPAYSIRNGWIHLPVIYRLGSGALP
jgi:hypothetical protein